MKKILVTLVAIALYSGQSFALECHGTEPFWDATVVSHKVEVSGPNFHERLPVDGLSTASGMTSDFLKVYTKNNIPVAIVTSNTCDDGMSDFEYPNAVIIFTSSSVLYGCCGKGVPTNIGDGLVPFTSPK